MCRRRGNVAPRRRARSKEFCRGKELSREDERAWDRIEKPVRVASVYQWLVGIAVPLTLIGYGTVCVIYGHGAAGDRFIPLELSHYAKAFGIMSISVGSLIRYRYMWDDRSRLSVLVMLAKDVSLVTFIMTLMYMVVCVGLFP